ncbi:MAG: Ppx/GppA family phosphatase [Clostridia bacterium]|nr:Ppx/GppA family phosphatase [Clostridia bacterium]
MSEKVEKIAIIDLGSNTARLVLVNVYEGGFFVVFDELKETVRLGQDMDIDGFLRPSRIEQTKKTLLMFRRFCDSNGIEKILAYATAAVRRAKNQKSFLEEVSVTCGIKLKVLTSEEEGLYTYTGVINSMDIPKGIIMDMGGGSTQFVYYNRRNILAQTTLPFGTVTLTDLFKGSGLKPEEKAEKIEEFVRESLEDVEWLNNVDPEVRFIGVGGSFRNLGKISRKLKRYPLEKAHNYVLDGEEFERVYDTIKVLPIDRTMKIKGLSSGRADIFPSALSVMKAVMDCAGFKSITVSGCGLREGAMFRYAVPSVNEKPINDILGYSLQTLVVYFNENQEHAKHVADLSMQLFKQLKVLHKLPRAYFKVLRVAAILHDSGATIKYYDHPKHSAYVILNSSIYGISQKEIVMAAFVASAHKKGEPDEEFNRYKCMLTEEDIAAVYKMGVILKIAESFDRSMSGLVTGINCDVLGDSVIMQTESTGDCSLEIQDALSCRNEFKRAYGKNVEIL